MGIPENCTTGARMIKLALVLQLEPSPQFLNIWKILFKLGENTLMYSSSLPRQTVLLWGLIN